ncbi:MAG: hypothetical protein V4638_06465 [Bacteroidota bacterium]
MKSFILTLMFFNSVLTYAQNFSGNRKIRLVIPQYRTDFINESNNLVYTFDSYEDFVTNNGTNRGRFETFSSNLTMGDPKLKNLWTIKDDLKVKILPNDYFGFKINGMWFINKTFHSGKKMIMICLKEKGKIFYGNGFHYLSTIENNSSTFSYELDKFYYSDSINSIAIPLKKITKREKNNEFYKSFISSLTSIFKKKGDRNDLKRFTLLSEAIINF